MKLELDHMFILVEPEASVADLLVSLGMKEGTRNKHKGQGTSNRRFYFSNGMLEFLWVHDASEAVNGPGRELFFSERSESLTASPFGVILHRKDSEGSMMPFEGWSYQPDYFKPPWVFHVGENSTNLSEPLCFYVPFRPPEGRKDTIERAHFNFISEVQIKTPARPLSKVMSVADTADRLSIEQASEHLMEITFDDQKSGCSKDFRPDIPLIIHW